MSETGMQFIQPPTPHDRIVAVKIVGTVTIEEMRAFIARVQAIYDRGEKALVYQELASFDGIEWGVLVAKMKAMGTLWKGIARIAVVSESRAYRFGVEKITDHLTPMDMRSFDPVDRDMAFAWLLGQADAPKDK